MRRRNGFTVLELVLALSIGSVVLVGLYTALVFYTRAYTREDEQLERSRRSQEILGLFRDDFERAQGTIDCVDVPAAALKDADYEGEPYGLLATPRLGTNVINAYETLKSAHPRLSKGFTYREQWGITAPIDGQRHAVRVDNACFYAPTKPVAPIGDVIPPWGATVAAIRVPVPYDNPKREYYLIRKVSGGQVTPILWTFFHEKTTHYRAGDLLRWTPVTGTVKVGGDQLEAFTATLQFDYAWTDPLPPERPGYVVRMLKTMCQVEMSFGRSHLPAGQDPGFAATALLVMGP